MAFKIKEHAKEFDIVPEVSHEERLLKKRERDFIENDKKTFESIATAYEAHREIMDAGTQDDRIMHYSTLHIQRGFASYLIGEGFIEEEDRIKSGNSQYKSLNQLFESNEKKLPFDKKTMYQYIQIAKAVTFDDFRKLGVKKTLIVAQVKDNRKREQIIKAVSDCSLSGKAAILDTSATIGEIRGSGDVRAAISASDKTARAKGSSSQAQTSRTNSIDGCLILYETVVSFVFNPAASSTCVFPCFFNNARKFSVTI